MCAVMNPQQGLVIRPFRKAHLTRDTDRELFKLKVYLLKIARLESLARLNHRKWENYAAREIHEREFDHALRKEHEANNGGG